MRARYPGYCRPGDHPVNVGDEVSKYPRVGWVHPRCHAEATRPMVARVDTYDGDAVDRWEAAEARRQREHDDAEYAKGVADVERWHAERKVYGAALADRWAAEDEFNRYWKYGEDY